MLSEDSFAICGTSRDEDGGVNNGGRDKEKYSEKNGFQNNSCVNITKSCFTCNGYYGPCFEDPLCFTCHKFLFPIIVPSKIDQSKDTPLSFVILTNRNSGNNKPVDKSQESKPNVSMYEELVAKLSPVEANPLTKKLEDMSDLTHPRTDINIEFFPPEVLMNIFKYLDEISLWSVGQVCDRWREIVLMCVKNERWKNFVRLRWPILPIGNYEQDWYELYTAMMCSSCCLRCITELAAQKLPPQWKKYSWRRLRVKREIEAMIEDPLDGIEAVALDANYCYLQATIEGPAESPYEGGLFLLYIQLPKTYPLDPPIVRFITKIFHPNVSRHGDIGIDSIQHNWSLALTIGKLLLSIQSLLTDPSCYVCMEPEIGNMYLKNRKAFEEQARLWTSHYAMHAMLPY